MKNKPNPEWTEAMLSAAKTTAELFPTKFVDHEAVLLSEQALAGDWLKPEEEAAWAHLQSEKL
ncbi:MAG: hypothetical protein WAW61_18515 [Methylococcaceae bacterium]